MNHQDLDEFIAKVNSVASAVERARQNIQERNESFANNERQTRSGLIDPVLKDLGWDVSRVDLVGSEFRTRSSGTADYALFDESEPVVLIEAKRLGYSFDISAAEQLSNYTGNEPSVRFAVFTNGDHWRMREKGKSGTVFDIYLSSEAPLKSALELMRLGRDVLASDHNEQEDNESVGGVEIPRGGHPELTDDEELTNTETPGWVPLSDVKYFPRCPRPTRIRLPDQSELPIASWKNVWISIAEWVVDREPQMTAGSFGNTKPTVIKTTDEGFWGQGGHQLSNGLWIEPGVTGNTLLRTARSFLKHFNVEPNSVSIRFD